MILEGDDGNSIFVADDAVEIVSVAVLTPRFPVDRIVKDLGKRWKET